MSEGGTQDLTRLLKERAALLARRDTAQNQAILLPHVAFQSAGELFAVPLHFVVHASRLRHLTPIPGGPPYLIGVCALGGHLVTVLDVATFLDLRQRGLDDVTCCLVVSERGRELGLCAERLLGIEDIPPTACQAWSCGHAAVTQVATVLGKRFLILDLPQLLADPRLVEESL
ncbi:MAG TPA: chemotaxis protein CheW [Pseudomonadota bacterium]|nr:chemotaxis protein CheW [Pseudomonadota bacterium]